MDGRRSRFVLSLLSVLLLAYTLVGAGRANAQPDGCEVIGGAFGAVGTVEPLVSLGPVGLVTLPPGGETSVANIAAGTVLTTGAIVNSAADVSTETQASSTSSSTVNNISLLNGLVTATTVRSVATSTSDGTTASSSAEGTTIENLVVAGVAQTNVAANTVVEVPGVGSLIINEQIADGDGTTTASLMVNALHLVVTTDAVGLPAGAEVIIASASSAAACGASVPGEPTPAPGEPTPAPTDPTPTPGPGEPTPAPGQPTPTPAPGDPAQPAVPGTGVIGGTVVDAATGQVLPGATVELLGGAGNLVIRLNADANGSYRVHSLEPGCYSVRASFPGYQTVTRTDVCVTGGQTTRADLALPRGAQSPGAPPTRANPGVETGSPRTGSGGRISGTITDAATGRILPGAAVEVLGGAGNLVIRLNADANGAYLVHSLQPGCYSVRASLSEYATATRTEVCVTAGQTAGADLALRRAAASPGSLPDTGMDGTVAGILVVILACVLILMLGGYSLRRVSS